MKHPYMPLWVGDYLSDTQHLTAAEHGAYMLLIMAYWQRGKALDNSNGRLANVARMSNEEWTKVQPTIAEFFEIDGDLWTHKRIEREISRAKSKSEQASSAGKASAQRRLNGRSTDVQRGSNPPDPNPDQEDKYTQLPSEQEAAPAKEQLKKFDLNGVGVGLGQGEVSPATRLAVARKLNIGNADPLVAAYREWGPSRGARSVDAHFRTSAPTIFANMTDADKAACQPLSVEPQITVTPVAASPQLVAKLNSRPNRHARH